MISSMKSKEEVIPYSVFKNKDSKSNCLELNELLRFKSFYTPSLNNLKNIPIGKNLNKNNKKIQDKISNNNSNSSLWNGTVKNDSNKNGSSNIINYLNTNINTESIFILEKDAIEFKENPKNEMNSKEQSKKNTLKLNKSNAFILHTESSSSQPNKDNIAIENVDLVSTRYLNNHIKTTKSEKNLITKKSSIVTPNPYLVSGENVVSLSKLLKSDETNIQKDQASNYKSDYFNSNNIHGAHQTQRSISEIQKINTFRSSFNNSNNNNDNNDKLIKDKNCNKNNLCKDFRKTSFLIFSESLKLNKDKNIGLISKTSKKLSKNSRDQSNLITDRCKTRQEDQEKDNLVVENNKDNTDDPKLSIKDTKKPSILETIENKTTSTSNLNNINIRAFGKSIPKIKLDFDEKVSENHNGFQNKNNNVSNNKLKDSLNIELLNAMPNLALKSKFQRNIIKEEAEKNTNTESFNKDFCDSYSTNNNIEESFERAKKQNHESAINSFLNKFEIQRDSLRNYEDNYFNDDLSNNDFYSSPRNFDFNPPADNEHNKKSIFGFKSNFDSLAANFKSSLNKKLNLMSNTQKCLFDIYNNKNDNNNVSNLIPKSNHFIALNKSNSFKYFSNYNRENTDNEVKEQAEEKKEEIHNYKTKNNFCNKKGTDIKFSENHKNFYKDELRISYSNCFSPQSLYNNSESQNFDFTTTNNFYAENPTSFETDLKRKTTEFSKTSKMKFYQAKTTSFKKLAEFNRRKIKNFLLEESKNNELLEKIEKSKEAKPLKFDLPLYDIREVNRHCFHGFRENATSKFMEFILNKEEKMSESRCETNTQREKDEFYSVHKTEFDFGDNLNLNLNRNKNNNNMNNVLNFQQNLKRIETRRDTFICNKPLRCFSDGRTHSFSEIFERRPTQKFPSLKVSAENLKKCLESIAEEKKLESNNNKIKAFYDKLRKSAEIEIPDMQYLRKVNRRVNNIVKKPPKQFE